MPHGTPVTRRLLLGGLVATSLPGVIPVGPVFLRPDTPDSPNGEEPAATTQHPHNSLIGVA
ncbi:hypothetical protein [Frankia sp. EAN1pec]|uniref:hypothetical protein n=1 Tax=Parafrankia sp. (strain EAN1pec) TaxID=298653 RepID=UPI0012FB8916